MNTTEQLAPRHGRERMHQHRFTLRFASVRDLPWCSRILDDGFQHSPELKAQRPDIWRRLITSDAMHMIIISDDARRLPVAFGATAFLPDSFVQEFAATRAPHLARSLMQSELQGQPQILRPEDVRRL